MQNQDYVKKVILFFFFTFNNEGGGIKSIKENTVSISKKN